MARGCRVVTAWLTCLLALGAQPAAPFADLAHRDIRRAAGSIRLNDVHTVVDGNCSDSRWELLVDVHFPCPLRMGGALISDASQRVALSASSFLGV